MKNRSYRKANCRAWNQAVDYHLEAKGREWMDGFKSRDYTTFTPFERVIFSRLNLKGRSVVQAPCSNGREVLSLINMGAASGAGIDIVQKNIDFARSLRDISGARADFHCSDIYEIPEGLLGRSDIAIITAGSFNWMPDLREYLSAVRSLLREDGELFIFEMHPLLCSFPYTFDKNREVSLTDSYFSPTPFRSETPMDYYGHQDYQAEETYEFQHTMADIIQCLTDLGFRIREFQEHPVDVGGGHEYLERDSLLPLSYHLWVYL